MTYSNITQEQKIELGNISRAVRTREQLKQEGVSYDLCFSRVYMSHLEQGRIGVKITGEKPKCPWSAAIKLIKYLIPYCQEDELQSLNNIFGEATVRGLSVINIPIKELISLLESKGDVVLTLREVTELIRKDLLLRR